MLTLCSCELLVPWGDPASQAKGGIGGKDVFQLDPTPPINEEVEAYIWEPVDYLVLYDDPVTTTINAIEFDANGEHNQIVSGAGVAVSLPGENDRVYYATLADRIGYNGNEDGAAIPLTMAAQDVCNGHQGHWELEARVFVLLGTESNQQISALSEPTTIYVHCGACAPTSPYYADCRACDPAPAAECSYLAEQCSEIWTEEIASSFDLLYGPASEAWKTAEGCALAGSQCSALAQVGCEIFGVE